MSELLVVRGNGQQRKERANEDRGWERSRMRKRSEFSASPVGSDSRETAIASSGCQNYKGWRR
jgi:hypothetical protein